MLPAPDEVRAFVADPELDKRARLIDELLERKEFVELWVMKWSELLQVRSNPQVSYKATLLYYNWLQDKNRKQYANRSTGSRPVSRRRRDVYQPGHQLLPKRTRHSESYRKCRPSIFGNSDPMRSMPQSSIRSLDDG